MICRFLRPLWRGFLYMVFPFTLRFLAEMRLENHRRIIACLIDDLRTSRKKIEKLHDELRESRARTNEWIGHYETVRAQLRAFVHPSVKNTENTGESHDRKSP